jgi:lipopolysaccharide transport system ATP-binding protein
MNSDFQSSPIALNADALCKQYYRYSNRFARIADLLLGAHGYHADAFHALLNLTLAVRKGEAVALVGRNGSGKSTLLKMIAGVATPTSGVIQVTGRVAALLELGTGFHPELTGRENLQVNARLLGLSEDEIATQMDKIIAFAELGDFIDQKIRTYSSGMLMRLGFSLSTHVNADILLVDEALAVGDAYFQAKCLAKIQSWIKDEGKTLLYVSHDPATIKMVCSRAILLSHGKILGDGTPELVLDHYNALLAKEAEVEAGSLKKAYSGEESGLTSGDPRFVVSNIKMADAQGNNKAVLKSGDEFMLECTVQHSIPTPLDDFTMGLHIRDLRGYEVFGTNTWLQNQSFEPFPAGETRVFRFKARCNIGPGRYTVGLAFHKGRDHATGNFKWIDKAVFFDVVEDHQYLFVGAARVEGTFECKPVS